MLKPIPHIIDVFGHTIGRDHLVMKMDRALDLVRYLDDDVLLDSEYVFFDPFCKAGELLLASALLSAFYRGKINSSTEIDVELYAKNRFFALSPDEKHWYLSKKTFCGRDINKTTNIRNGNYLTDKLDIDKFQHELNNMLEHIRKTGGKRIVAITTLPGHDEEDQRVKPIYDSLISSLGNTNGIEQLLVTIPERWFASEKTLLEFPEIRSGKIKYIRIKNSRWVFPSTEVKEGICFVYGDKNFTEGVITLDNGNEKVKLPLQSSPLWKKMLDIMLRRGG